MPTVDIPFPRSSLPGQRPGEGQGRLVNCFCEVDAQVATWRPVPGLVTFTDTLLPSPRGAIEVGGTLYEAREDRVVKVTSNGLVTLLSGTLAGTDLVTWARNNKAGTPDVMVVSSLGASVVTASAVSSFSDPDLPQPNSVSFLEGFFLFTIGDGRVFASDLNSTAINALSFATCESSPDGLLRGTVSGQLWFGWGTSSCEVWQNVGATPFPLSRVSVIPLGLIGPWAIAGFGPGWGLEQIFVASDGTVRRLQGYTPQVISSKDVERAIQAVSDKTQLVAMVYVEEGHPIWSLSSPFWTWDYNVSTGFWHERQSDNAPRWRASQSVYFDGRWLVGDTQSTKILDLDHATYTEVGDPLTMLVESGPAKQFPSRMQVLSGYFDWTTGTGALNGNDDEVNPSVGVQWSRDGGASWSNTLVRRSLGKQGQFDALIRVNRAGLTTQHGMRWRLTTSSPVYRTFRGGRMDVAVRG